MSITDTASTAAAPHRLVAAMASLLAPGGVGAAREAWREPVRPLLATHGGVHFA